MIDDLKAHAWNSYLIRFMMNLKRAGWAAIAQGRMKIKKQRSNDQSMHAQQSGNYKQIDHLASMNANGYLSISARGHIGMTVARTTRMQYVLAVAQEYQAESIFGDLHVHVLLSGLVCFHNSFQFILFNYYIFSNLYIK